jgi:hypothetical protein
MVEQFDQEEKASALTSETKVDQAYGWKAFRDPERHSALATHE